MNLFSMHYGKLNSRTRTTFPTFSGPIRHRKSDPDQFTTRRNSASSGKDTRTPMPFF